MLAIVLTVAGCVCLYLSSPNQKWRARPWPGRLALAAGGLLLLAGLATAMAAWQPLCAVFMMLHVAMVCLFAFPYAGALRGIRRSN